MEKDLIVNINEDINLTVESPSVINLSIEQTPNIDLEVSSTPALNLTLGESDSPVDIGMDMMIRVDGTPYTGQTAVIPSDTRQVLPTSGTLLTQDITIEPIPQNYGLITWNGSTLTVS